MQQAQSDRVLFCSWSVSVALGGVLSHNPRKSYNSFMEFKLMCKSKEKGQRAMVRAVSAQQIKTKQQMK